MLSHVESHMRKRWEFRTLNIITITKTTKLFLTGSIPYIKPNWATICVEDERMYLNAQCRYIFLFKFTSQMAFDERRLTSTTIADKYQLNMDRKRQRWVRI